MGPHIVNAELESVLGVSPSNRIGDLIARFIGEGWPLQEGGHTHVKAVGNEDVGGQPQGVGIARRVNKIC